MALGVWSGPGMRRQRCSCVETRCVRLAQVLLRFAPASRAASATQPKKKGLAVPHKLPSIGPYLMHTKPSPTPNTSPVQTTHHHNITTSQHRDSIFLLFFRLHRILTLFNSVSSSTLHLTTSWHREATVECNPRPCIVSTQTPNLHPMSGTSTPLVL